MTRCLCCHCHPVSSELGTFIKSENISNLNKSSLFRVQNHNHCLPVLTPSALRPSTRVRKNLNLKEKLKESHRCGIPPPGLDRRAIDATYTKNININISNIPVFIIITDIGHRIDIGWYIVCPWKKVSLEDKISPWIQVHLQISSSGALGHSTFRSSWIISGIS